MTDDKIKDTNKIEDNVLKHTISAEDLRDMLGLDEYDEEEEYAEECENDNLLPPIMIEIDDYDLEEFDKGIKDASYLSGYCTAILNAGLSEEFLLTYLINKETIAYNLENIKLNNATNLEISKNQKIILEKQEL